MQSRGVPPPPEPARTAHPFLTYDTIHDIPAAMRETLRTGAGPAEAVGLKLARRSRLYFTGCGTAFFSALLAARITADVSGERAHSAAVPALELSGYTRDVHAGCGVVGVSHSGITKTTVDALRSARDRGAATVGITHFPDRPIGGVSDSTLVVGNGPDPSRCHTKCYLTGALAATMIGLSWAAARDGRVRARADALRSGMDALPDLQSKLLSEVAKECDDLATAHLGRRGVVVAGFGPNEPTALETALKLMETSFMSAQGMETEQFLHGPTQSLDEDTILFVVVSPGPGRSRSLDLLRAARTIGAHTVAIAPEGDHEVAEASETTLAVPAVDEFLSPFLNIIPLYLFAYHASVKRGHNPDVLRYLEPRYWAARNIVFPPGAH